MDPVPSSTPPSTPPALTWQQRCLLSGCDIGSVTGGGTGGGGGSPPGIDPLKGIICATSILAFIGSPRICLSGLFSDINCIQDGLLIASPGLGLGLPPVLH